MRVSKIPKGRGKTFAAGGKQKMFGAGDRTRSKYPAEPQRPGQTAQHSARTKPVRKPGRAPVDTAGDMGGSAGASMPRRQAA
jgi:hypothetical protein